MKFDIKALAILLVLFGGLLGYMYLKGQQELNGVQAKRQSRQQLDKFASDQYEQQMQEWTTAPYLTDNTILALQGSNIAKIECESDANKTFDCFIESETIGASRKVRNINLSPEGIKRLIVYAKPFASIQSTEKGFYKRPGQLDSDINLILKSYSLNSLQQQHSLKKSTN